MENFWFKAKNYGWGWQPNSWQGWLIILIYIVFITYTLLNLNTNTDFERSIIINFVPKFIISTILLLVICYKTGEKPYWRWGK